MFDRKSDPIILNCNNWCRVIYQECDVGVNNRTAERNYCEDKKRTYRKYVYVCTFISTLDTWNTFYRTNEVYSHP